MGFYPAPDGVPPLINDLPIVATGYCAIVPRAGVYSIKQSATGANTHETAAIPIAGSNRWYVPLASTSTGYIYINDNRAGYIYLQSFAKGAYESDPGAVSEFYIRTPQQMLNITQRLGATFHQERDIDFAATVVPHGPAVVGTFAGTYNGGGFTVSNMTLTPVGVSTPVGLFRENNGTIRNLTLTGSSITGTYHTGAVAGINTGTITDVAVVNPSVTGNVATSTDGTVLGAGGVAGRNSGTIRHVTMLPATGATITGAGYAGGIAGINGGTITDSKVVSNARTSPIATTSDATAGGAGGIAGSNVLRDAQKVITGTGSITRVLYLARAPGANPIVFAGNEGDVVHAFYLSGLSHDLPPDDPSYFFNMFADPAAGEKRTTVELRGTPPFAPELPDWPAWVAAGWGLPSQTGYPYPHLGIAPAPGDCPVVLSP
jgi:hypothetical protein